MNGFPVELPTSRRLNYAAVPDLVHVHSEPHTATTSEGQRINLDRSPVSTIQNIRITKQSTASLTHGSFTGAADPLPEGSVLEVVSVTQGGVAYTGGTDYKLSAGKVDWSLPGIEPATGSTYQVVFKHIKAVQADAQDETGVVVSNAVPGTLIQVSYSAKLPRIDRLALNEQGEFFWFSREPRLATASLRISARVHPTFPTPCCPSPACRATRGSRADVDNRAPGYQRRRARGAHVGHRGH